LPEYGDGGALEEVYIEALDAAVQEEQAQRLRWAAFEERLSSIQRRAYLEKLAAFAGARGIGNTHVLGRFLRDVAKRTVSNGISGSLGPARRSGR
jgi:hypothetical protein